MERRRARHHDDDAAESTDHEGAPAPVWSDPDEPNEHAARVHADEPAPVYPTEADELDAIAHLTEHDPSFAHASTHLRARAIATHLRDNAERAVKRQRALAPVLADERAPVFPTEAHEHDLRDAIPTISDAELRDVINAGHGAYLASLDAHEPVTTTTE